VKVLWIAMRELRAIFSTVLGWMVLTGFLLITGVFWTFGVDDYAMAVAGSIYNPYDMVGLSLTNHLLLPFFGNCTVIVLMVTPALSMRLFSEELRNGTLELLLTSPISATEIVLGKYLGSVGFLGVLLACTAHYPLSLWWIASPDLGVIAGGYLALFLLGSAILALGLAASAYTENQVVALVTTFALAMLLYVVSFSVTDPSVPLYHLSLSTHVIRLIGGAIQTADLVYFGAFIAFFLFLAQQRLELFRIASAWIPDLRHLWMPALAGMFGEIARRLVEIESLGRLGWTLMVTALALVAGFTVLNRRALVNFGRTRHARLVMGSLFLQGFALAVAVGGYHVVQDRFDRTIDLTQQRSHTLSDQTRKVLAGLDEPVEIVAYFTQGDPAGQAFRKLAMLVEQASDQVTLTWVDPLADPVRAEVDRIAGATVVVKQAGREQRLEIDFDETNLARRLVLVQDTDEHLVCWARGHGEADPDGDTAATDYGAIVLALEATNYQVLHTTVAAEGIPRTCEVLVVVRPMTDWLPFEREALAAHVAEGRHAILLLDPAANTPGLNADLERFHLSVTDDIVFDADLTANFPGMEGTLAVYDDRVLAHPITEGLGSAIVLPVARSVGSTNDDGIVVKDLLRTSGQAWGETNLDDPDVRPDPGVDRTGALPLAVLAEVVDPDVLDVVRPAETGPLRDEAVGRPVDMGLDADPGRLVPADFTPAPGGKVLLVGDADFASNQMMAVGNNKDFFLNVVAWMVGEEEQLGERPTTGDPLELSDFGSSLLCLVSLVFVPGTAVLLATVVLLRRRRL
jgi:ABC-2 type transport system permease protein